MPELSLNQYFARWMLPLAVLAGVVLASVPPAIYNVLVWQRLSVQARIYAGQIAASARDAAFHQPYLWRFNIEKIVEATTLYLQQDDIASIELTDCAGKPFFSSDSMNGTTAVRDDVPVGSAPIVVRGRTAAFVSVKIDPEQYDWALLVTAMVSIPLGLAMGLLLFFFPTRVVRRQSRYLSNVMDELRTAKQDLAATNQSLADRVQEGVQKVRALSQRVVQTQEDERQRIARDLHDELGHAIASIQMEAEVALTRPDEAQQRLQDVSRGCETALKDLRRVVRELRPVELETQTLSESLRSYAEAFEQRSGVTTYSRYLGDTNLPSQLVLCLLRVLREALTNVGRHANAHEVGIRVHVESLTVMMEVTDDGDGFDPVVPTDGAGLLGMRERCELLGGDFAVKTAHGQGTTIRVQLPIGTME